MSVFLRMIRLAVVLAVAVAPAAAGAGIASAQAVQAAASSGAYGAFAYSPSDHADVGAATASSVTAAEIDARADCGAFDCIPVAWFEHADAGFDVGPGGDWGWGYGPTEAVASANALHFCGEGCQTVYRISTSSPSTADTGADLIGRVCMINAPSGALDIGHVGWAYLVNRDTGTWEFGANEGPVHGLGSPSETWHASGTLADMEDTFATASHHHSAGYYTSFDCQSGPWNDSSAALGKVNAENGKPYDIPSNDCLSNAISVIRAYGDDLPNPAYTLEEPNAYYLYVLALVHFEGRQPLIVSPS